MQITFVIRIYGLDHGMPSNLKSEIGHKIGVGKDRKSVV